MHGFSTVSNSARPWPEALNPALVKSLERLLEVIPAPRLLTDKDRNREAKRLARNARKLLDDVRAFHEHFYDADVEDWKSAAEDLAVDSGLNEHEVALFRLGFSPYSLQFPLNGLALHLEALARPGRGGRPVGWLQRHMVESIGTYFDKASLPVTANLDGVFAQTVAAAFDRLQWGEPDHYLREFFAPATDRPSNSEK